MSTTRVKRSTAAAIDKPLRADAARNRERVLAVARQVFEELGVSAEIDEIARRSGVGVGTIYRHFPTKAALIQGVAESYVERLVAAAHTVSNAADPGRAFFEYLGIVAKDFAAKQTLVHAIAKSGGGPLLHASRHRDAFVTALGKLLARAQKCGAVRADVNATDLIQLVRATSQAESEGGVDAAVRRRLFDIVCAGLAPRSR